MKENGVASILKTYAIINLIVGIILVFNIRDVNDEKMGPIFIGSIIISSIGIYAFGEVISLLQGIYNKVGSQEMLEFEENKSFKSQKHYEDNLRNDTEKFDDNDFVNDNKSENIAEINLLVKKLKNNSTLLSVEEIINQIIEFLPEDKAKELEERYKYHLRADRIVPYSKSSIQDIFDEYITIIST